MDRVRHNVTQMLEINNIERRTKLSYFKKFSNKFALL